MRGQLFLFGRRREDIEPDNMVLAALYQFLEIGKSEVSLSEVLEAMKRVSERTGLDFDFDDRVLYSSRLFKSVDELDYRGFVQEVVYRHDHFLPKSYLSLSPAGRSQAKVIFKGISDQMKMILREAVETSEREYRERWKYWARPSYNP